MTLADPCLFALNTTVALRYETTPEGERSGRVEWPGKATANFSDALACPGRRTWAKGFLQKAGYMSGLAELPTACGNYH